jgi:hypothetical protein
MLALVTVRWAHVARTGGPNTYNGVCEEQSSHHLPHPTQASGPVAAVIA